MPDNPKRRGQIHAPDDVSDQDLWRAVTDGVKPLKKRTPPPPTPERKPAKNLTDTRKATSSARSASLKQGIPQSKTPPSRPAPDLAPGIKAGVDKRTANRLRKGRLPIEGRLDLHGYSREGAYAALTEFILSSHAAGKRCVLIVTGKGRGILQSETPRWLNQARLRDKIVSIDWARPQDGGSGAIYVLLRRHRDNGKSGS